MASSLLTLLAQNVLFLAGALAVFSASIASLALLRAVRRQSLHSPARSSQTDLAHMIILLQTMKDILEEQKKLARQINDQIEQKMAQINARMEDALAKVSELRSVLSSEASAPIALVTKHDMEPKTTPAAIDDVPRRGQDGEETDARQETRTKSELSFVASLPTTRPANNSHLENWVGIELADEDAEFESLSMSAPPEQPEDPEAARQAFRTLLNIVEEKDKPADRTSYKQGNGRRRTTPLQARVYEYRDAGMTISQIAKELGIGKGEVRLILSLRKNKG